MLTSLSTPTIGAGDGMNTILGESMKAVDIGAAITGWRLSAELEGGRLSGGPFLHTGLGSGVRTAGRTAAHNRAVRLAE
jgi:hypothetical protein